MLSRRILKSARLYFKPCQRFERSLVAKIVLSVERENRLNKKVRNSRKAAGRVKNVIAGGESARMNQGEFRDEQRVSYKFLLKANWIGFDCGLETRNQSFRVHQWNAAPHFGNIA